MHTTEARTATCGWPRWLSWQELADGCARLRLFVDPAAPIGQLITRCSRTFETEEPDAGTVWYSGHDIFTDVLTAIAAPTRTLLLLRQTETVTTTALFLQREDVIVRFAPEGDRCLLSAPWTREQFADNLCDLLDIADWEGAEPATTPSNLVGVAAALQTAPTDAIRERPGAVASERKPSAASSNGTDPASLLNALVLGDVVRIAGDDVHAADSWLKELALSLEVEQTRVYSIEVPDIRRRVVPRRLVILGRRDNRRLVCRPAELSPGRGRPTRFAPADRKRVSAALLALTAAPPGPPRRPRTNQTGDLARWLSAPPRPIRVTDAWARSDYGQIMLAAAAGRVPEALVNPIATVECRTRHWGVQKERIIGLGVDDAVEWQMDGALVCWRSLDESAFVAALIDMLPRTKWSVPLGSVEIGLSAFRALVAGPRTEGDLSEIPPLLHSLARATHVTWLTITAMVSTGSRVRETRLVVASCSGDAAWQFDSTTEGMLATPTTTDALRRELVAALCTQRA